MAGHEGLGRALRRWLPGRLAPAAQAESRRDGPRIAVIGNCQARGIARALAVLLPRARVETIAIGRLGKARRDPARLEDALARFDHVFAQPLVGGPSPDGRPSPLHFPSARARLFPALVFIAFHPDQIYVGDAGTGPRSRLLPSPLHTYHSAIVLYGHLRGLDVGRISGLFREETFAALGYLDLWQGAAADLLASSRAVGFDLGPEFPRWSRRGAFMHGINHPHLFVLADIARRLAREAGLAPVDVAVEAYLGDDLLDDVIWPIYPPVGAVYGLPGSYLFKRRGRPGAVPALVSLEAFVAESLALYRRTPRARLRSHRTDHWDGVSEVRALFDAC